MVNSASSGLSSTNRISTSCDMHLLYLNGRFWLLASLILGRTENEEKRCSLVDRRLGPNSATVPLNDALHDRQANSSALEIAGLVQALKNSEKLFRVLHLEADPVVANKYNALAVLHGLSDLDHSVLLPAGVLHSIREQIHEYLFHQSWIAFRAEQVSHLPLHVSAGPIRRNVF